MFVFFWAAREEVDFQVLKSNNQIYVQKHRMGD